MSVLNKICGLGVAVLLLNGCVSAPNRAETVAVKDATPQLEEYNPLAFEGKTIVFGSDATYAPFEFTKPNGDITGFDIQIAKALCDQMKAVCEIKHQDWDVIIPGLLAKKYDVIASSMDIYAERKKSVAFTQKIWTVPSSFIAQKGVVLNTTPEGLKGKYIGVQSGTSQDFYAAKYFKNAKIKRYKTKELIYEDLRSGRLDLAFMDRVMAQESFLKKKIGQNFTIIGDDVWNSADAQILGEGTGFAVRKEDTVLLEELNKAFDAIRASGQYEQIARRYFDFDIYGR
jgi:histidine transport system substrate-binding protein